MGGKRLRPLNSRHIWKPDEFKRLFGKGTRELEGSVGHSGTKESHPKTHQTFFQGTGVCHDGKTSGKRAALIEIRPNGG